MSRKRNPLNPGHPGTGDLSADERVKKSSNDWGADPILSGDLAAARSGRKIHASEVFGPLINANLIPTSSGDTSFTTPPADPHGLGLLTNMENELRADEAAARSVASVLNGTAAPAVDSGFVSKSDGTVTAPHLSTPASPLSLSLMALGDPSLRRAEIAAAASAEIHKAALKGFAEHAVAKAAAARTVAKASAARSIRVIRKGP